MATIHWLGAGLSSAPGIQALAGEGRPLVLWNRTLAKAESILAGSSRQLDFEALKEETSPGDVLVSMLPADMHRQVAELALTSGAHFVSSSYVSDEMQALDEAGRAAGLCLVNEVGLDPGIDHLMAHALVARYRNWGGHHAGLRLRFRSYCGGFPAVPNPFRYKFSWSPVGVLRALKTPARCLQNGSAIDIERPWQAISQYRAALPAGLEPFEAYPNRDSLPFLAQYHFEPEWQVDEFVRGTLRLPGWTEAWQSLFEELDSLQGDAEEARIKALSDTLWEAHRYAPGEADRVVLCVELESVDAEGQRAWYRACAIDAEGNAEGSAMARLVSRPVALAVRSVLAGDIPPGVSTAPDSPELTEAWFAALAEGGDPLHWSGD